MPVCFDVAVVGGGAAGLAAAISAARGGAKAVLCDRMPRLGKKILITGGGRCNLMNEDLSPKYYTSTDLDLVASVFGRFGKNAIRDFFSGLGLGMISEDGRVFPATNQAASVLKVLEIEVRRLGVAAELLFEATAIERTGPGFTINAGPGRRIEARKVILAGGGKAYPALGSNGSGYSLAQGLGHHIIPPVPSAVPLLASDPMCHVLQGQKWRARAVALIDGNPVESAEGEVLFTQYGLSGTAILDVSESLSIAHHRQGGKKAGLSLDLVPFLSRDTLAVEFVRRMKAKWAEADLISGLLPEKFAPLVPNFLAKGESDTNKKAVGLAEGLKDKRFSVLGTRGWNEAEFTSGGVDAREVNPGTLESKHQPGLFFAGEILDVQGRRGGYNLAWAWASGCVAGRSAT
jgi:predicted Rossmann fold flavoprotein